MIFEVVSIILFFEKGWQYPPSSGLSPDSRLKDHPGGDWGNESGAIKMDGLQTNQALNPCTFYSPLSTLKVEKLRHKNHQLEGLEPWLEGPER